MVKLAQIEEYLRKDDRPGLSLRLILSVIGVLWAAQAWKPIMVNMRAGVGQNNLYLHDSRTFYKQLRQTIDTQTEIARLKGSSYNAWDYYATQKAIDEADPDGYRGGQFSQEIGYFGELYRSHSKYGPVTERQSKAAKQAYDYWKRHVLYKGRMLPGDLRQSRPIDILWWSIILLLRGTVLVAIHYLIAMAQRRGIAQTLLADKQAFVLAVAFWPIYIWRYPFNVVREIMVEAELRRIGGLFRQFSQDEREKVREIAASLGFREWIRLYRAQNAKRFQCGLFIALIATLILYLVAPLVLACARSRPTESPPARSQIVSVQSISGDQLHVGASDQQDQASHDIALPSAEPKRKLIVLGLVRFYRESRPDPPVLKLAHVPLS